MMMHSFFISVPNNWEWVGRRHRIEVLKYGLKFRSKVCIIIKCKWKFFGGKVE